MAKENESEFYNASGIALRFGRARDGVVACGFARTLGGFVPADWQSATQQADSLRYDTQIGQIFYNGFTHRAGERGNMKLRTKGIL
jgi:hypothetical protein